MLTGDEQAILVPSLTFVVITDKSTNENDETANKFAKNKIFEAEASHLKTKINTNFV